MGEEPGEGGDNGLILGNVIGGLAKIVFVSIERATLTAFHHKANPSRAGVAPGSSVAVDGDDLPLIYHGSAKTD